MSLPAVILFCVLWLVRTAHGGGPMPKRRPRGKGAFNPAPGGSSESPLVLTISTGRQPLTKLGKSLTCELRGAEFFHSVDGVTVPVMIVMLRLAAGRQHLLSTVWIDELSQE